MKRIHYIVNLLCYLCCDLQMGPNKGKVKPPGRLRRHDVDPVFGERQALPSKMLPLVSEVGQALLCSVLAP